MCSARKREEGAKGEGGGDVATFEREEERYSVEKKGTREGEGGIGWWEEKEGGVCVAGGSSLSKTGKEGDPRRGMDGIKSDYACL